MISCKKTGIKDYSVRALYIKVPLVALDTAINTYQVEFDRYASDGAYSVGFNQMNYLSSINLLGYKKVNFGADLNIILGIGNGYFYDKGIQTNTQKDKNGVETKTYFRQIEYSNFAFYRLFDKNRQIIDEQEVQSRSQSNVYKTAIFSTLKDCEEWWSKNGNNKIEELRKEMINNSQRLINNSLNSRHSWTETTANVEFKTIKDKENRDFKKWQSNDEVVKLAFRTMTSFSTTEYAKRISPAIEFWDNMYKTVRGNDEKTDYIRWACLHNIVQAYYWMDDFDMAREYAF
ncbi:MAG TPA: hypothetical protein PKD85_23180, partial [Saprospiraceae bacterium]|nr:hypothetical protein [Saprospiraceae bacterium]